MERVFTLFLLNFIIKRFRNSVVKPELFLTFTVEQISNLFYTFQGITYDTGGADIKAGGVMAGMHRYK